MKILVGEAVRLKAFARPFVVNSYLASNAAPKLHLGCGTNILEGWLNADRFKAEADIYLNVIGKLPFANNTFDVVFSEHMLEHIFIDHIPRLLSEIQRVLKPGGIFRFSVPDLELYAKKYVEKDDAFFKPIIDLYANNQAKSHKHKKKHWLVRTNGGAFMSRAVRRFYHHHWMYDFPTFKSCLLEVGFSEVIKQQYGVSRLPFARQIDKPKHQFDSLYIDAIKP